MSRNIYICITDGDTNLYLFTLPKTFNSRYGNKCVWHKIAFTNRFEINDNSSSQLFIFIYYYSIIIIYNIIWLLNYILRIFME